MVESVYGIPAAAAARATPTSANGQPKPMPPVGPTAIGSLECAPRIAADVSIFSTPASICGAVVGERGLVLGRAVEEIEYRPRQPLFRDATQVLDVPSAKHARGGAPRL